VVTTLLLNFIVLLFVSAMLDGPMKDPAAMGWPQSVALQDRAAADQAVERSRVHTGLLIALGLPRAAVGAAQASPRSASRSAPWAPTARPRALPACRWLGHAVKVALLSGALAGLAGAVEVAGRTGYVTLDMSPGYGYSGIVIAMLAALHPLGVVAAASSSPACWSAPTA
jgi:general nucleoside transport system permease protein